MCPNFSFSLRVLSDVGVCGDYWVHMHSPPSRGERRDGAENLKLGHSSNPGRLLKVPAALL